MFLDGYRPLININRKKEAVELQLLLKISTSESSRQAKVECKLNGLHALTMRVTGTVETFTYATCMYIPSNSVNTETLTKIESYIDSLLIEPLSFNMVCGDFNIIFKRTIRDI